MVQSAGEGDKVWLRAGASSGIEVHVVSDTTLREELSWCPKSSARLRKGRLSQGTWRVSRKVLPVIKATLAPLRVSLGESVAGSAGGTEPGPQSLQFLAGLDALGDDRRPELRGEGDQP